MPNAADNSDEIIVVGTKESTEKAMHEIQLISDEQASAVMHCSKSSWLILGNFVDIAMIVLNTWKYLFGDNKISFQSKQAYEKLEIPKQYHPFICGANNEKINTMMTEHNVRINVPPPSVMKNEMTIAGEKEGVLKCKDIIQKYFKEMVCY